LASLRANPTAETEILVVDNASTDSSASMVQSEFPEVRLLCSIQNLGFGGGNNLGARQAFGQYLAFLNPDTEVAPGWLEALLNALETTSQVGLVTSKILLKADPQRINTCGNDVHLSGLTLCRGMGCPSGEFQQPELVNAVSGAAFALCKDLYWHLGGFDDSFFLYMEDTDLSLRARLAGYRCLLVPASIVYHDYVLSFSPQKTYYQERNRYLMLLKSLRRRTLLALLPALLAAEVVTWGFVLLRERKNLCNKLQAYAWIARHWNEIKKKHLHTQAIRRMDDRSIISVLQTRLEFELTGDGWLGKAAHWVFDPLFKVLKKAALGWM
jgi:GT2 family glycosyltransferase